jgi:hypothetical protein
MSLEHMLRECREMTNERNKWGLEFKKPLKNLLKIDKVNKEVVLFWKEFKRKEEWLKKEKTKETKEIVEDF